MLTIRQEQNEAFRQHHLKKFEDEMVEHLDTFAPQPCKMAGEAAVRAAIRLGINHAGRYGLTNRGPVRFYIELMFMFGSHFDSDPQHTWATAVLYDPETVGQTAKAERLFRSLNSYLDQVPGPNNKNYLRALHRLNAARVEDVAVTRAPLEQSAANALRSIYPEACSFMGDQGTRTVVLHSFEKGRKFGFTTPKGMLLMVALSLFMGHAFPEDPLCRWIARRLDRRQTPDSAKRIDDLHAKAMTYLRHVLDAETQN